MVSMKERNWISLVALYSIGMYYETKMGIDYPLRIMVELFMNVYAVD